MLGRFQEAGDGMRRKGISELKPLYRQVAGTAVFLFPQQCGVGM
jgi:hypothetical protein